MIEINENVFCLYLTFKASCSSVYLPDCSWFLFDDFLSQMIEQVANKNQFTLFLRPGTYRCHHESQHVITWYVVF